MKTLCSAAVVLALILMAACGGGGGSSHVPTAPVFTSTPGASAAEGAAYTYQVAATDPEGKSVAFALTLAPSGATLSGNTITWTPSAAQSRVQNDFTLSASTASGSSATQTWSVTPSGTVHVSQVFTYWKPNGTSDVPLTIPPRAIVPQQDGSYKLITGTSSGNGIFDIPNVPGGYFWVQPGRGTYWTSSSAFDAGADVVSGESIPTLPTSTNIQFNFDLAGLDAIQEKTTIALLRDAAPPMFPIVQLAPGLSFSGTSPNLGATTYNGAAIGIQTNMDFSQIPSAYVLEYNPIELGTTDYLVLGPGLQLTNPSWQNGATNLISGTLSAPSRSSFHLNIQGSAWAPMFDKIAPMQISPSSASISIVVDPYFTKAGAIPITQGRLPVLAGGPFALIAPTNCGGGSGSFSGSFSGTPSQLAEKRCTKYGAFPQACLVCKFHAWKRYQAGRDVSLLQA